MIRVLILALVMAQCLGCGDFFKDDSSDQTSDTTVTSDTVVTDVVVDPLAGKALGEACDVAAVLPECRFGLDCVSSTCQTVGGTEAGRPCVLTGECQSGNYCGVTGLCGPAGSAAAGQACSFTGECEAGLVCLTTGFSGSCGEAGTGDIGASCTASSECLAGLACGEDGACMAGGGSFGFQLWDGVDCDAADLEGPARVYFEFPSADSSEFFRLPYPNDIRMDADGTINLAGFPSPGPGIIGFDAVARIRDAADAVQRGASTTPTVFFRFSQVMRLGSVWAAGIADPPPGDPTLYFVNIDPDSPGYKATPAYGYFLTDGGARYICPRYLAVHPSWDTPLLPETTYAVILAKGVETPDGVELAADADMTTMLAPSAPSEPAELAAWNAYARLRAYLQDSEAALASDRVIAAAVFTTQPTRDVAPKIRAAIHAQPAPTPADITLCDGTNTSPCDDGLSDDEHVRGCFDVHADVHELHMRVPIPKVQSGTAPYLKLADGGDLARDASGDPELAAAESVCVSLTIPKAATMPDDGWPLAIYGHGTGGNLRSSVSDVGVPLASLTVGAETVAFATVGWDGPMHGERRGADLDPDGLFFNVANPLAARGNVYQGAADMFALVRAFSALSIAAESSPIGAAIRFDPSRIAYIGHSQGATTGAVGAPWEPDVGLYVWSGGGAGLVLSLLNKTKPIVAKDAVAVAIGEIGLQGLGDVGDTHPVMSMVQGLFDPVDALNHASAFFANPPAGVEPRNVLHVYGLDDSFTPPATIELFAKVMRIQQANPVLTAIGGAVSQVQPPVSANVTTGAQPVTAVLTQTQPAPSYDGHFVLFRDAPTQAQFQQFLGTWVVDGTPTLPPR